MSDIPGYVYLMKNERNGYFKIGFSKKPPSYREYTLQSQEPEVSLVAYAESFLEVEKIFHKHYGEKRVRGEWFALDQEQVRELSSILEIFHAQ